MTHIDIHNTKRTKMVATIGPSTNEYKHVEQMLHDGVNGFRLNFSHGTYEERIQHIAWVREASAKLNKPVAIIQDLQGPKIRLGDFEGAKEFEIGKEYSFALQEKGMSGDDIPMQYDLSQKVQVDERVLIADGRLRFEVAAVDPDNKRIVLRSVNGGSATKRKGINVPDTRFDGDIITEKDIEDIKWGATQDLDFVALSFVQTADDIHKLRTMLKELGSNARIIAKVETKAAVENIESIVRASDAVMVARGDMALEVSPEAVPIAQRQIIGLCRAYGKVSIVATQMLATMTENLDPTRAEVSDVATAVIVGADALMLSDETASGKHPHESVRTMKRIILYTQANLPLKPVFFKQEDHSIQSSITSAAITLAEQVNATAIVAETKSGATARSIASHRPTMPIIVVTSEERTAQQLAIVYGSKSYVRPDDEQAGTKLTDWLNEQKVFVSGETVVTVSGRYPGRVGSTDTIKIRKFD